MTENNPTLFFETYSKNITDEEKDLQEECDFASVEYQRICRANRFTASVCQSLYTIFINNPLLLSITSSIIGAAFYEALKTIFCKLLKKTPANRDDGFSELKLMTDSGVLEIKDAEFSNETISKAIDALIAVSIPQVEEKPVIPTYVVLDNNKIAVYSQKDFFELYQINKKEDNKENNDGQA